MAFGVAFGAAWRTSVQQSRWITISVRRRLRVAQSRMGMPIRSAYHRAELFAAPATEPETMPARPSDRAAFCGESLAWEAATPKPATKTSASGSSQMNSR